MISKGGGKKGAQPMGGSLIAALPAQRLLFAFRSKPIKPDFQEPWQEESHAVVLKVCDERPLQINPQFGHRGGGGDGGQGRASENCAMKMEGELLSFAGFLQKVLQLHPLEQLSQLGP